MKVVLIHGQNHKGSSYNIGRMIANKIATKDEIVEFFLPKDLNHFCVGCYKCVEIPETCPFYEEKNKIMKEVESAEILIFSFGLKFLAIRYIMQDNTTAPNTIICKISLW